MRLLNRISYGLFGKAIHHSFDSFRLIRLFLKFQLHHVRILNDFDFSGGRDELEYLLDVDFHVITHKTGITEHHSYADDGQQVP